LTLEMDIAPHADDVMERMKIVGVLAESWLLVFLNLFWITIAYC
jgi:hypothetical protein